MADEAAELSHIYSGTFVTNKDNAIIKINGFYNNREDNQVMIAYVDMIKLQEVTIPFNEPDYNLTFPDLGNINSNTCCVFLSRLPVRQYKRTIANNNYRKEIIGENVYHYLEKAPPVIRLFDDKNMLKNLFFPSYFSYQEAVNLVREGKKVSAAFSKNLSVSIYVYNSRPVLFYKTMMVGLIDNDNTIILFDTAKHLKEQIQATVPEVKIV